MNYTISSKKWQWSFLSKSFIDTEGILYYNHYIMCMEMGHHTMEWILSGYCRAQDQARSVFLEQDGEDWDWGCDFPGCAFSESCTIAKQIRQTREEQV